MKNIDYNQFSAGELEAMLGKIDIAEAEAMDANTSKPKESLVQKTASIVGNEFLHDAKENVARPIGRAVRSVAGAAGDFADLVSSPLNLVGIKPESGKYVREGIDSLTGDYLKPRNDFEGYVDAGTEMLAGIPLGVPAQKASKAILSGGQKAALLVKELLSSQKPTAANLSGAAAAGMAGKYMAEENPFDFKSPLAQGAASFASSVLAGSVPGMSAAAAKGVKNSPQWAASKMAEWGGLDPAAVENARIAGIDILPADALNSKIAKKQQNILLNIPFVGGKIQAAMDKRYDQALEGLGQSSSAKLSKEAGADLVTKGTHALEKKHSDEFQKLYGDIGKRANALHRQAEKSHAPIQKRYDAVQNEIQNEIKNMESAKESLILSPKQKSDLDAKILGLREQSESIKKMIPTPKMVDPTSSLNYLNSLRNKLKTEEMQKKFDASPIGQKRESLIKMAAENNGTVPYADMIEFRQNVQDSVNNFGIQGEIKAGQRKKLTGLLNQDVIKYLKSVDPELATQFQSVNFQYGGYTEKILPAINKVIGKDKKGSDLDGFLSILPDSKNGGKALTNVLKSLDPEESKQLFDIVINHAGTDHKGNFSMVKAYNYFNSLTDMTQERLLAASGKTPNQIKQYKSTMETVNNVWKTSQQENHSGSAKHFIQHTITASIMYNMGMGNWYSAAKEIGALGLGVATATAGLKNNRLINAMYKGFQKNEMTKDQFYNFCDSVSNADSGFKKIIQNTLRPSAINAAKANPIKEIGKSAQENQEIDYNQYSLEELEAMEKKLASA